MRVSFTFFLLTTIFLSICGNALALTVDVHVMRDKSAEIFVWLDMPASADEKEALLEIRDAINARYPFQLAARPIENDPKFRNEGISLRVNDLRILQDSLNCMDFSFSKSFFKEKFYMKVMLNPGLLNSEFFSEVRKKYALSLGKFALAGGGGAVGDQLHSARKMPGKQYAPRRIWLSDSPELG